MKRWIKPTIIATTCLVPISFVISFAIDWSHKIPISCVGSSGVKPFVEYFGNQYSKQNKKVDVTVDAGGSGFGISQVANGYCNIGNASKNPFSAVETDFKDQWNDNRIKTITISLEAICVVWIPPKDLHVSNFEELDSMLEVNKENINDLFRIFSGFNDGMEGNGALGMFCNQDSWKQKLDSYTIKPYVRAGGALTSGTASSFYTGTYLDQEDTLNQNQKNALLFGRYGSDRQIYDTDEANSRAWEMFKKNNISGSMVYLSSGFVIPNIKLIRNAGYGIMSYHKESNPTVPLINGSNHINDGYGWSRPLNTMVSLNNCEKEKDFFRYIFNNVDKLESIGAKPLSETEKWSMVSDSGAYDDSLFNQNLFEASDIELSKLFQSDWDWNNGTHFGADLTN